MDWTKLHKFVEAINSYYAFAVLMYAAALYVANNSRLFWWVLAAATPLLAGWTGYLIRSYLDARNQKHGFQLLSHAVTYEILPANKYRYRLSACIKAEANRMMVYPVGYQWSGEGAGSVPRLGDKGQYLIGAINKYDVENESAKIAPYKESISSEGDWYYWFIGLSRALYKGETADIKYTQEFSDPKKKAKPYLYHMVNTSIKRLELNVKFPENALPKSVSCSYFKLSDRRRTYSSKGLEYSTDKQLATWVVEKPKFGYCYRIDWQY